MKTLGLVISLVIAPFLLTAQTLSKRLDDAIKQLENDAQMKSGQLSLYVINSKSGSVVYNRNGTIGLPTGSTQKVITSVTAFEQLGKQYRYKTEIGYNGTIEDGTLNGDLIITGYGDPTLGSWRYAGATQTAILTKWISEIKKAGINKINGNVYLDASKFSFQPIPGGWIWDDMGNYYGAGVWGLNWHENQYDLYLQPGKNEGDDVQIITTEPTLQGVALFSLLKTGKKGSGDNAYIYCPPYSGSGYVIGTVPAGDRFKISGSFPNPVMQLQDELKGALATNKIIVEKDFINSIALSYAKQSIPKANKIIYTHLSPSLDSINFYFLRNSINLYGEALVKTIALEKNGVGDADDGLKLIKEFWKGKGVETTSINIQDGSGLSPQNRITTQALTTVMKYAEEQTWFSSFYNALPTYNNLKMKSGTIGGTKSFTGYSTAKDGTRYTFAIVVNNYNGATSAIVNKMYKVLDILK